MKIAFIASGRSWHTVRWFRALKDSVDFRLFTFFSREGIYGDRQVLIGSPYPQKLAYLLSARNFRTEVEKFKPDIVHAHYATGHGFLGSRLNMHPFVVSVWGSDIIDFPHKSFIHRAILKSVLKRAEAVCVTSETLGAETMSLYPEFEPKINVIPFGIDLNLFKPSRNIKRDKSIVLGTAKLLENTYQLDLLMKTFDIIARVNENIRLKIAGNGPERENLLKLKNSLASGDRIEFVGEINNADLPVFLQNLDIFVNPSRFESYGVAALEASACGLPVVGFDVGGLHEIVENRETGILVQLDDKIGFETAMRQLIEDRSWRETMGRAAREKALKMGDINMSAEMLLDLYKSLL